MRCSAGTAKGVYGTPRSFSFPGSNRREFECQPVFCGSLIRCRFFNRVSHHMLAMYFSVSPFRVSLLVNNTIFLVESEEVRGLRKIDDVRKHFGQLTEW